MSEPNFLINSVLKWLTSRPFVIALIVLVVIVAIFGGTDSCRSRKYDKERAEYEEKQRAWTTERATRIADAEAKEKRIAELEPKAIAFDALAEQNKRIDAGLAKQIEEVSKNAADEEARAEAPTDCRVRAQRVCDLLSANRIKHDCATITAESCAGVRISTVAQ